MKYIVINERDLTLHAREFYQLAAKLEVLIIRYLSMISTSSLTKWCRV